MHIKIGDLVRSRKNGDRVGVVVKKSCANSSAMSQHSKDVMRELFVYYVYFPLEGYSGPYYPIELTPA